MGKEVDKEKNIIMMKFEGEYLNGERNGQGKEYLDEELIFEGEYLNGKRNGKGKEYFFNDLDQENSNSEMQENNILKFEGEYLNGKIWNGKTYDKNGILQCEIKEGKGNIKEYNVYSHLIYEGEYINGERNGKGKEYKNNEIIFEGEYLKGKKNGQGKEYSDEKFDIDGENNEIKKSLEDKLLYE